MTKKSLVKPWERMTFTEKRHEKQRVRKLELDPQEAFCEKQKAGRGVWKGGKDDVGGHWGAERSMGSEARVNSSVSGGFNCHQGFA